MRLIILAALLTAVTCGRGGWNRNGAGQAGGLLDLLQELHAEHEEKPRQAFNKSPSPRYEITVPEIPENAPDLDRKSLGDLLELLRGMKAAREVMPRQVRRVEQRVAGGYVVVLKSKDSQGMHASAENKVRSAAFRGLDSRALEHIKMITLENVHDEKQLEKILADPDVAYVEEATPMEIAEAGACIQETDAVGSWGQDRIDQHNTNYNNELVMNYNNPVGEQVMVYVIDTGVFTAHQDFDGCAEDGGSFVPTEPDGGDLNGHGTHVAGTICSQTYGVNKEAQVRSLKVLNASGHGNDIWTVNGVNEAVRHHNTRGARAKSVINMSLRGPGVNAVDDAVRAAKNAGIVVVVAAGNDRIDASRVSPARCEDIITVGGTDRNDRRYVRTNYGPRVDILGPAVDITSLWIPAGGNNANTATISGTSMATPHVAAVAAQLLMNDRVIPNLGPNSPVLTPDEIWSRIHQLADLNKGLGFPADTNTDIVNANYCQDPNK